MTTQSPTPNQAESREVHSQPAWIVRNDQVELAVTQIGAQMAPVTFFSRQRRTRPALLPEPLAG